MEIEKRHGAKMILNQTKNFEFGTMIDRMIEEGSIGMIVGPAKSRKSMLALNMCLSLISNQKFLGFKVGNAKRKILYINLELTREALGMRLRIMKSHYDNPSLDNLFFFNADDFVGDDVLIDSRTKTVNKSKFDELIDTLTKAEFGNHDLVVIDPLYYIVGEENDNSLVTSVLRQLARIRSRIGCGLLVVHHCKKDRVDWSDPFQAGRGASSIGGFFEFVVGIEPSKKNDAEAVIHHGSRNLKTIDDFSIVFDDELLLWRNKEERQPLNKIDEIFSYESELLYADYVRLAKERCKLSKAKADKLIESSDQLVRVRGNRGQRAKVIRK